MARAFDRLTELKILVLGTFLGLGLGAALFWLVLSDCLAKLWPDSYYIDMMFTWWSATVFTLLGLFCGLVLVKKLGFRAFHTLCVVSAVAWLLFWTLVELYYRQSGGLFKNVRETLVVRATIETMLSFVSVVSGRIAISQFPMIEAKLANWRYAVVVLATTIAFAAASLMLAVSLCLLIGRLFGHA
ncbi:MAG: hypothetical protein JSU94_04850 [Phycisphaerales bacterium]|nr:MAG: hypothetical protein JSU94_04850 [Phycisphaerales bacterium]